jgi:hypothetical protein
MLRNLLPVILVAIILTLLVPITDYINANELAFTPDNLIKIQSDYK